MENGRDGYIQYMIVVIIITTITIPRMRMMHLDDASETLPKVLMVHLSVKDIEKPCGGGGVHTFFCHDLFICVL